MLSVAFDEQETSKKGDGYSPAPLFLLIARALLACLFWYGIVLILWLLPMGIHPLINDLFRAAKGRKCSCVHSPAVSRRVARRIAVVRRDRADHPPRTDHPPAQYGT